jgi:hypothetical protein
MGTVLSNVDKQKAHEACLRALAESSDVVQKA